jgi:glutathione peroxidase
MTKTCILSGLVLLATLSGCKSQANADRPTAESTPATAGTTANTEKGDSDRMTNDQPASALDFTVKDIDGNDVPLSKYRGRVVLIVNVASKCGLTPQYEGLQKLHEQYADQGLAILGFPANNFLRQEPDTNAQIKAFCSTKYGVAFDMFTKVSVKGRDKCELYEYLTSKQTNPQFGGELKWNFTKFLLDRDGRIIGRFEPRVRPGDARVVQAIEAALKRG